MSYWRYRETKTGILWEPQNIREIMDILSSSVCPNYMRINRKTFHIGVNIFMGKTLPLKMSDASCPWCLQHPLEVVITNHAAPASYTQASPSVNHLGHQQ